MRDVVCARCDRALRAARASVTQLSALEVLSAATYEGTAAKLVAALKFSGRTALADIAAEAMANAWLAAAAQADTAVHVDAIDAAVRSPLIVPVPASAARARLRGFDPTRLLARAVAARLGGTLSPVLRRTDGPRQVGRSRAERRGDPPRIHAPAGEAGSDGILLIDDVVTTGATLEACAQALRAGGARGLRGLTFARAKRVGAGAADP